MGERLDPRVIRTRKMLQDALIDLIGEKGYEAVSVRDITERAGLNRATFYLHYHDKPDMLQSLLDDTYTELIERALPPINQRPDIALTNVVMLFEHIAERAAFYRVLLGDDGPGAFRVRVRDYLQTSIHQRIEQLVAEDYAPPVPLGLTLRFLAESYVGVIQWWLEQGQPQTPPQMADHLLMLVFAGPYRALGFEPPESKNQPGG